MRESDPPGRGRPENEENTGLLPPVKAFFLLIGVGVAAAVAAFATQPDAAPSEPPATVTSPDFSLTDAEAIEEFERLKSILLAAYWRRDVTLLDEFAAPDAAPGVQRVDDEIRTLLRDGVLYRTREARRSLAVTQNDPAEVELTEVLIKTPRFLDEQSGENVATGDKAERQIIVWVLRLYGSEWKIHSATVTSAEPA